MNNTQKKQEVENAGAVNPVVAAGVGAVVGASVAVAGAVIMQDEKNRDKVQKVFTNVKDHAVSYMEGVQKQAEDKRDEIEGKVKDVAEAANKAAHSK